MPRVAQRVNYNTFSGGKVSDANPITPPENVVRTLLNVDVELNGKIGRRLGIEPEDNFNLPVDINNDDTSSWLSGYTLEEIQNLGIDIYTWENVGNQSGINYKVVRIGDKLYVYNEGGSPLSNSLVRVVDISAYSTASASEDIGAGSFQATSGKGLLICAGSFYSPFYVEYNASTGEWSDSSINIRIRDFEGVDDGLDIDERPSSLSANHHYNLQNQGWRTTSKENGNHITSFFTNIGSYPSNADIDYLGNGGTSWDSDLIDLISTGNTLAPRGHFIIDPFSESSRETVSGINVGFSDITTQRPKSVAFFAGRIWYGSVQGRLYYSKVIESTSDLGLCYQEQDPTAEQLNEVLDTDGGTLPILDIGEVVAMSQVGDSLVVLGENGIWGIGGGDSGFTANRQLVYNLSRVKVQGYRTVVSTESSLFFWAEEGIYVITPSDTGSLTVQSLSKGTIQKDFNSIPSLARSVAQGTYDRINQRILWSYSYHTSDLSVDIKHKYTDVLIFNITLGAFSDYRLTNENFLSASTDYPIMCGIFNTTPRADTDVQQNVTVKAGGILLEHDTSGSGGDYDVAFLTDLDTAAQVSSNPNLEWEHGIYLESYGWAIIQEEGTNALWRSSDGQTWTQITSDYTNGLAASEGFDSAANNSGGSMSYSPDLDILIIVHSRLGPQYSTDGGITWNNNYLDAYFGSSYACTKCVWEEVNQKFLLLPNNGLAPGSLGFFSVESSDGINWTSHSGSGLGGGTRQIADYVYSQELQRYVIVFQTTSASSNSGWYSDNGRDWTAVTTDGGGYDFRDVALNPEGPVFYASGSDGGSGAIIRTSSDGITYTTASSVLDGLVDFEVNDLRWSDTYSALISLETSSSTLFFYAYPSDLDTWTANSDAGSGAGNWGAYLDMPVLSQTVTDGGENVTVTQQVASYTTSSYKIAMLLPDSSGELRLTFGQFSSRAFGDWDSLDSTSLMANTNYTASFPVAAMNSGDYTSVVETLPQTLGEPSITKQGLYVHTYYDYRRGGYNEPEVPDEFDS